MSQLDGKQIKNTSLGLNKINPATGQTLTLVGTSKIQQPQAPLVDDDLANKAYVDSIAAGLDLKPSVQVATTTALPTYISSATAGVGHTLLAATFGVIPQIDSHTLSVNERILVKNQNGSGAHVDNGIYYVSNMGSTISYWELTRATDADGTPTGEVTTGMFTFVEFGLTNSSHGYVLVTTGTITLDTTPLQFTQFSDSAAIVAGAGLYQSGNQFNVGAGAGIIVGATQISVDYSNSAQVMGGAGLTANGNALDIQTTNGVTIIADAIGLGGAMVQYTNLDLNGQYFQISDSFGGSYLQWNADLDVTLASNNGNITLSSPNITNLSGLNTNVTGDNTVITGNVKLDLISNDIAITSQSISSSVVGLIVSTSSDVKMYTDSVLVSNSSNSQLLKLRDDGTSYFGSFSNANTELTVQATGVAQLSLYSTSLSGNSVIIEADTTYASSTIKTANGGHYSLQNGSSAFKVRLGFDANGGYLRYADSFWISDISGTANTAVFSSTGNFGIGLGYLVSPSTKLHIVATASGAGTGFRLQDTTEGAGKVLTSDASGVATWQPGSSLCEFYSDGSSLGTTLTVLYTTSGLIDTSNLLAKDGDKVKGVFSGYFTGATASTKSVHLYFGGNDLFGSSALAYNSPSYWRVEFCIIRSNSSQIRQDITFSIYDSVTNLSHIEQSSGAYAGFDFTTDEVIEILGQSVGGGSADGDIISRAGYIEYTPSK